MSPEVVIAWMEAIRGEISITQACAWLGIPRSNYYRWKSSCRVGREDNIVGKILELCTEHKFRYGYRKITSLLRVEQQITFYLEKITCTTTAIVEQIVRDYINYYKLIRIQTKLNNQSQVNFRRLAA
ncbi:hypothetical protein BBG47_21075 [Paenibacillus sp. KS1]|nr:hypothetical protein BBG47_21075 [Paenibacillus sp. KS1]